MNEETTKLIRELAEKLGTTTEHLWAVLIRQAPISSLVDLVLIPALAMALWLSLRIASKGVKGLEESFNHDDQNIIMTLGGGAFFCLFAILLAFLLCDLDLAIAGLLNPEYWALKQIIK